MDDVDPAKAAAFPLEEAIAFREAVMKLGDLCRARGSAGGAGSRVRR
jgi:hypothetical protein